MVPGTQVGAYRMLQQIGEGGMGTVWLAEHAMLGRRAAIKLLHPMFTARPEIVSRFFNEARAATAIADPGIVQIFDFGHHVDGTAYIAMEMLEGEPLDKRLRRLGRLPIPDALRILRQIASTLGVAHLRGIVHRDLKPENIYLVRDPEVAGGERAKVLDFGIAKLTGDTNVKTHTSAVMGTPAYMSPEQCRGAGQVDQRSDVYALGCMLFALISGAPPFDVEGAGEIIAMHLRESPPALSSRAPGVSPELEAIVQYCLAKDPAHRYASGAKLAAAIGGILGRSSVVNLQMTGGNAAGMGPGSGLSATTLSSMVGAGTMPGPPRSSRGFVFAAVGALVAGGGIAAVVMARGEAAPASAAPVASSPVDAVGRRPPPMPPGGPPGSAGSAGAAGAAGAERPPGAPPPPGGPPPGSAPPPGAMPPPPPPLPDPNAKLAEGMRPVLTRFVAWAHDHAGAPCPTASLLGPLVQDPWGHPLEITCTDQPANQVVGAISAGPDGKIGTSDDVGSWQLGRDVTDLVHGARWSVAPAPASAAASAKPDKPVRPVARPKINNNDDIPTER
jgi:tRNA A-37 threonylcarbamoyl transferase component Bud32